MIDLKRGPPRSRSTATVPPGTASRKLSLTSPAATAAPTRARPLAGAPWTRVFLEGARWAVVISALLEPQSAKRELVHAV